VVAIVVSRPPKLTLIALRQGKQTFRRHLTRAPYRRDHAGAIVGDILFSDVDAVAAGVLGAVEGCIVRAIRPSMAVTGSCETAAPS
jgi:hypothetical protein